MAAVVIAVLCVFAVFHSAVAPVAAIPSGMTNVPNANVSEDLPVGANPSLSASELEGSVMTDAHAESLEVIVTTPGRAENYVGGREVASGGSLSIVLRDDVNAEGRRVALDAEAVRSALGHTPKRVWGTNEDGSEWTSTVEYRGGLLVFSVPHFSSNTVSFSGTVTVTANPAVDGSAFNYEMNDVDSATNPNVTLTGSTATETDTETFAPTTTDTSIQTFDPSVAGDSVRDVSVQYQRSNNSVTEFVLSVVSTDGPSEAQDDAGSHVLSHEANSVTVTSTESYYGADGTADVVIKIDGSTVASDRIYDNTQYANALTYDGPIAAGANVSVSISSANSNDGMSTDVDVAYPSTGDVTVSAGDASRTISASDDAITLTPSSFTTTDTISVDRAASSKESTSLTVDYTEEVETTDPSVSLNGNTLDHLGTLSDGESTTLTGNATWIREGTNTIDVSVGDGTLSADAPTPQVQLNVTHGATDEIGVDYGASNWQERYQFNRTFATAQSDVTVSIPFAGNVVDVSNVETRLDGGSWTEVSDANQHFDGTTLTIALDSVGAGETIGVRATGRKVRAVGGDVSVTEPSTLGEPLDTKLSLSNWGPDAYIAVNETQRATRLHYIYQETYDDADAYSVVDAAGNQRLTLPNAANGSSVRVATIPVEAAVGSNDATFRVVEPSSTQPVIEVRPGQSAGDTVTLTYLDATSGDKYRLWSTTNQIQLDSATANSPVSLTDDDGRETIRIEPVEDEAGGGGAFFAGGGGNTLPDGTIPAMPIADPVIIALLVLASVGGAVVYSDRRRRDDPTLAVSTPVYRRPTVILVSVLALVLALVLISPESVTGPLNAALNAGAPLLAVLGVLLLVGGAGYWLYTRRQAQTQEAATPDTVIQFSGGEEK